MALPNFPLSSRTINYNTYDFEPTGDPATDTPAWEALVAVVNAVTPTGRSSTIRIRDNGNSMVLDVANSSADTSEFTKACWVRGETKNARIQYNDGYIINWGRYGNPIRLTDSYSWFSRGTIAATQAFTSKIVPTGVTLAKGDHVVVWSENAITEVPAHYSGGSQRPAELHRVNHEDAGGWVLDCDIVDPLTTNPQICKVEMLRNCGMSDLTFGSNGVDNTDPETPQISCVSAQRCHGFIMENIQADETGCGAVGLQLCADSRIAGFNGVWQPNNRRVYAVVIGVCSGCTYQDSVWHNTRHMVTSGGLQVTGGDNIRYGTARGCKAVNLHQWISGDVLDTAFAGMDLHAESWGFEFNNCHVYNSQWWDAGVEEFFAFSTRARNTRFIGCYVHSSMTQTTAAAESYYGQPATGFRIMGNDTQIVNCHQDRGWRGVWIRPDIVSTSFMPQRTKIEKCVFENISGPVVYLDANACNGIEMHHSTVRNCGAYYVPGGSPQFNSAILRMRGGTGHKIRFNNMDKASNNYTLDCDTLVAADFDLAYNSAKGYGSGKLGIRGDSGDPKGASTASGPAINTAFAGLNNVDA